MINFQQMILQAFQYLSCFIKTNQNGSSKFKPASEHEDKAEDDESELTSDKGANSDESTSSDGETGDNAEELKSSPPIRLPKGLWKLVKKCEALNNQIEHGALIFNV